ncbi:31726_t:CDS:1, partial [Gigaspora margarita]
LVGNLPLAADLEFPKLKKALTGARTGRDSESSYSIDTMRIVNCGCKYLINYY